MMNKKIVVFYTITFCIVLVFSFFASELLLRSKGTKPWTYASRFTNEPTMYEPDSVLGWRNKAGIYKFPGYTEGAQDIKITFLDDGGRFNGTGVQSEDDKRIVVIGGSGAQGWAVSDEETFTWKLQRMNPSLKFSNYGTGGYGTYQSLLKLEKIYAIDQHPPGMVLYAFIENHEWRNVATLRWLRALSKTSSRGHVYLPYCILNREGQLVRRPPERYPVWPFSQYSATISFFQDWYARIKTRGREDHQRRVTEQLLLEMSRLCKRHGTQLKIVMLLATDRVKAHYAKFLRQHHIDFIDCVYPITTPELQVPGEGHPNGIAHTLQAECIQKSIRPSLDDLKL